MLIGIETHVMQAHGRFAALSSLSVKLRLVATTMSAVVFFLCFGGVFASFLVTLKSRACLLCLLLGFEM